MLPCLVDEPRHQQRGRDDGVGQPHVESIADQARVGDERKDRDRRDAPHDRPRVFSASEDLNRDRRERSDRREPRRRQQPRVIGQKTGDRESLSRHLERRECHAPLEVRDDAVDGLQVDQIRQHEGEHRTGQYRDGQGAFDSDRMGAATARLQRAPPRRCTAP